MLKDDLRMELAGLAEDLEALEARVEGVVAEALLNAVEETDVQAVADLRDKVNALYPAELPEVPEAPMPEEPVVEPAGDEPVV